METIIDEYLMEPKNKAEKLEALARKLVERAVKDGTKDNTTVMIIELKRNV
mgnify:CR=1 FL=1